MSRYKSQMKNRICIPTQKSVKNTFLRSFLTFGASKPSNNKKHNFLFFKMLDFREFSENLHLRFSTSRVTKTTDRFRNGTKGYKEVLGVSFLVFVEHFRIIAFRFDHFSEEKLKMCFGLCSHQIMYQRNPHSLTGKVFFFQ